MQSRKYLENVGLYAGGGGLVGAAEALVMPPAQPKSRLAPLGPAIGAVWSGLFALMGLARARIETDRPARRSLDLLWLLCATYPLYTRGQRSRTAELVGNAIIGAQAIRTIDRVAHRDIPSALLLAPLIPWVLYATAIVLTDRR